MRALHRAGHEIAIVVTGPDRRRGRGGASSPSPVKQTALDLGLPTTERVADVTGHGVELGVVVAFGRLVRPEVLEQIPMVNVHFSLLPRWRGAAPVERAILAGDRETGVSIMALEEGLDTGPVYARQTVEIGPEETAGTLRERLGRLGTELLLARLVDGPAGLGTPVAQAGEPTYAAKVTVDDLRLDWSASAEVCHRLVRVGRAWTTFRGKRLVVREARVAGEHVAPAGGEGSVSSPPLSPPLSAAEVPAGTLEANLVATGDGMLELLEVQAEGRAAQPYGAWALGARPGPGERLGT
ncbi:MAG: fmt [Acidimicrobiaceae bacterium]|nr:fmt [Acidimicrobiaceae bacterium]